MLSLPFRAPSSRSHTTRSQRTSLRLEELESRALPSASAPAGWTAAPDLDVTPLAGTSATGVYTPGQIRTAYSVSNLPYDGTGQTIAIVDAYDNPTVAADLAAFDRVFGLAVPPSFVKAMPQGQPVADAGWSFEISLDVEWAHVIAPKANILLVEAKTNGNNDLLSAVDYARRQPGVVAVSMSWGGQEFYGEKTTDATFTTPANHSGVVFVAATGDGGAAQGPEWPSVSPNVVAVGGTTLYLNGSNYAGETGWSDGGGGYSRFEPKPVWQQGLQGSIARTTPDVAYNAGPSTGVYVNWASGWYSAFGTSAGAPQWAALVALADQARGSALSNLNPLLYALPSTDFHDVTSGSNPYPAETGYDLVTGRGTPFADRVVKGLVGLTANNTAAPAASSGTTSADHPGTFAAFAVAGDFRTAAGRSEPNAVPAAASARPVSDSVWLVDRAPLRGTSATLRDAAFLDLTAGGGVGSPSALYWNVDEWLSPDAAGRV
jgi:subtilase family serine protease